MGIHRENQSASTPPRGVSGDGNLDRLSLEFKESMAGFLAVGETDPQKGADRGRSENAALRFDVQIRIDNLGKFLRVFEHAADLSGTITFAALGGTFAIRDGRFNLFTVDPQTGVRQMTYAFRFTASDGQTYYLQGRKEIRDDLRWSYPHTKSWLSMRRRPVSRGARSGFC